MGFASTRVETVIDPCWLDRATSNRETVLASVERTGRLVVEDAMRTFSMGGQILDYLAPELFGLLCTSPRRVTGEDVSLRDEDIESAIEALRDGTPQRMDEVVTMRTVLRMRGGRGRGRRRAGEERNRQAQSTFRHPLPAGFQRLRSQQASTSLWVRYWR